MAIHLFYVNQVFIDNNGQVREKPIKRTLKLPEADKFLHLAKELKPNDKFYITEDFE